MPKAIHFIVAFVETELQLLNSTFLLTFSSRYHTQ